MNTDFVWAEMPANIALIKYMGKVKGGERNKPTNASLSLTLPRLLSRVELLDSDSQYDSWGPIADQNPWIVTNLSDRGRKRYLAHFEFLKQKLGIQGQFVVRSANNFPSDCGIASSASSFAALTQASYLLAQKQNKNLDFSLSRVAELSRVGSGSSIRSFMSPLVMWAADGISVVDTPYSDFLHQVVVVDREKKSIGSSDAHERVTSSLLFAGRPERAEKRLSELVVALRAQDWAQAFQLVWSEFWDMHALFATSNPAFHYMNAKSMNVLNFIYDHWQDKKDGPLVTMDAGANVHLIYRHDQTLVMKEIGEHLQNKMSGSVAVI